MSRFWHNRLAEITSLVCVCILALTLVQYFSIVTVPRSLELNIDSRSLTYSLIGISAFALLISVITRFWAPRRFLGIVSALVYISLLSTATLLLLTASTPIHYIAILSVTVLLAGLLGSIGIMSGAIAITSTALFSYLQGSSFTESAVLAGIGGALPLVVGIVLFTKKPSSEEDGVDDRSYHKLATQLSQVASKSDVVIGAIADGVIALNGKGEIELYNPAAVHLTGWEHKDAMNLHYKSVLKLVDQKHTEVTDIMNPIQKALNDNKLYESDIYSLETNAGKSVLISLVASPIGQPGAGVIVVFRDITGEKAEERQQAEFISTASHEMRTPVASIEGYLGLALNPATAQIDEKARDYILKAHGAAQHLGRLFQDLLDVSKADDGRLANNPKVVDVVPFVNEIVLGLKAKADEKQLRYIFKPMPDDSEADHTKITTRTMTPVFYANVDNDHLREIVANLIENAIKYTPHGDVVVDVVGNDKKIKISIADTGLGIPVEDQSHLFQKFYRVDNSDTREIGGTGLGLYLCRRLAETIGGRLWVESEYKKGSTFYLEVPRIGHEEATHLIEQASIEAERQAEFAKQSALAKAAHIPQVSVESPPVVEPSTYYPQYQPVQPQPIQSTAPAMQQPPLDTPVNSAVIPNTSLANIEANPELYLQPRTGVPIIPRR